MAPGIGPLLTPADGESSHNETYSSNDSAGGALSNIPPSLTTSSSRPHFGYNILASLKELTRENPFHSSISEPDSVVSANTDNSCFGPGEGSGIELSKIASQVPLPITLTVHQTDEESGKPIFRGVENQVYDSILTQHSGADVAFTTSTATTTANNNGFSNSIEENSVGGLEQRHNTYQFSVNPSIRSVHTHNTPNSVHLVHSNDEDDEEMSYPEGGWEAWRVVLGSFCGLTAVFGLVNSLGAIQAYVSLHQLSSKSESQVSWIFSVFVFISFLFSGQVGPLFDAYGPYHLSIAGASIFLLGLFTTSLCTEYYQFFLSFSLCCGLGSALVMTPYVGILTHWFNSRRAFAIGLATMSGNMGGIYIPIMVRKLYSSIGYPWALRTLAFIDLCLFVISLLLIKPRLQRSKEGLSFSVSNIFDYKALKDMKFTWLCIGNFLGELGVINGLTFLTSYALATGQSETTSYALLAILNSTGMIGRVVPGIIADKIGRFNTLIVTTTMAVITIFAIWLPFGHTKTGLIVFSVLHGFCNGGIYSLAPVCCGQVCRTRDYGRRYGTMYFVASFTLLVGVPVSGSLITDDGKNYTKLVIFNGCVYVGTTIALILSRYCAVGFNLKKW